MRKLQTQDVFAAVRLVERSGMKDRLASLIAGIAKGEADVQRVGLVGIMEAVFALGSTTAENDFYRFLAGPFEMKPDEVKTLDLNELTANLEALEKDGGLKRFFGFVSSLLSKRS